MITTDILNRYAPHAHPNYLASFGRSGTWLERLAITTSPLRTAHFLAQAIHASGGLYSQVESLWFTARELSERYPRLFPTAGDAITSAGNERAVAEANYGNRMGNHPGTDDAFKFRARGIFRIVGRNNYKAIGIMVGAEFLEIPDLVASSDWAVACAATIWNLRSASGPADRDDCFNVTKALDGRTDVWEERAAMVASLKREFGI